MSSSTGSKTQQDYLWLFWGTLMACLIFIPQWVDGFLVPKWLAFASVLLGLLHQQRHHLRLGWGHLLLALILATHFKWRYASFIEAMILLSLGLASLIRPLPEAAQKQMRSGLAVAGYWVVAYLLLQRLGFDPLTWYKDPPPGSFMGNPNFAGHFLLAVLCFGRFPKGRRAWVYHLPLMVAILLTGSRACYLGLILYAITHEALTNRWRFLLAFALAVGIAAMAFQMRSDLRIAATYISQPDSWVDDFANQPDEADDRDPWFQGKRKSIMTRILLWRHTLRLIVTKPMGVGMGRFAVEYARVGAGRDVNLSHHYRPDYAHNLVLDLAARFGIPFSIVCLGIGFVIYRNGDRRYRQGLIIQVVIAMVSLNYINAPVVLSLCLLRTPSQGLNLDLGKGIAALSAVVCLAIVIMGTLAYWHHDAATAPRWLRDGLFPEQSARMAYEEGDLEQAWQYQIEAWCRDPFGPEVHYNLAVMAIARSGPSPMSLHLLYVLEERHPFYRPTFDTLDRLKADYDTLPDREFCQKQFGNGMLDEPFLRNWQPN